MRARSSDRLRAIAVVGGLVMTALIGTAALARLALPEHSGDGRPQPDPGRPVAGASGPVLVPSIELSPLDMASDARQKRGRALAEGKGKAKATGKSRGKAADPAGVTGHGKGGTSHAASGRQAGGQDSGAGSGHANGQQNQKGKGR